MSIEQDTKQSLDQTACDGKQMILWLLWISLSHQAHNYTVMTWITCLIQGQHILQNIYQTLGV